LSDGKIRVKIRIAETGSALARGEEYVMLASPKGGGSSPDDFDWQRSTALESTLKIPGYEDLPVEEMLVSTKDVVEVLCDDASTDDVCDQPGTAKQAYLHSNPSIEPPPDRRLAIENTLIHLGFQKLGDGEKLWDRQNKGNAAIARLVLNAADLSIGGRAKLPRDVAQKLLRYYPKGGSEAEKKKVHSALAKAIGRVMDKK
jgi:hypothetical protein